MKPIAILETGRPPADLVRRFGDYPTMFAHLLGPDVQTDVFDVQARSLPVDLEAFAGAIVTGSPAGVYEDHAWIEPLLDWLRSARGRVRLVGICFGHQAMAQAFGGRVEKAAVGWGVGLHRYQVVARPDWMTPASDHVAIPVSHQDQVVAVPHQATVLVRSDFTPFAGLAWGDDAISFQCHPEFDPDYAAALVESRRGRVLDAATADAAIESLSHTNDRDAMAAWIRGFLRVA